MPRKPVFIAILTSVSLISLAGCATPAAQTPTAIVPEAPAMAEPVAPPRPRPELGTFGFDTAGMDNSVAAGDDFYAFANGQWARNNPIPADKSSYGMFTRLGDLSLQREREILDAALAAGDSKIGRAYASYLDEAAVEAKGLAPIQPWLTEVRALRRFSELPALLAKADRAGIRHMFGNYVGQDDRSPDEYILTMGQGGIGLPDRDYFLGTAPRFVAAREKYAQFLEQMLTLAGEGNAAARARAIVAYEIRVAQVHWDKVDASDATKSYNKMTVAAFQRQVPTFNLSTYLTGIGAGGVTNILVSNPSAIAGTIREASRQPIQVLRDQLIISSLASYADQLPKAVSDARFAFYGTALSGTPQREDRWKRAVRFTEGVLGDEVSKAYVTRWFTPETKASANALVQNILGAMGRRIDNLSWMQPQTKVRARAKLANFSVKIGYPDRWRSFDGLEIKADDLFGNAWRSNAFDHDYQMAKLGGSVRRWEWGMTPMEVNAYANFGMNEIVFPAAILQPPFFDPNADPAINYGGIGAVIGHEISHHFDDQGAKYDENGRLADWWTPQDVAAFEAAGRRLIEQYNAYEVLGERINGEFTLGENIGDLAGLAIAYDAYKTSLNGQDAPVIDGTTGDQRFFLGWAQAWRRNYRDTNLLQRLTTDPHSPSIQRAWVVRNLDQWYSAYGVQPGARLYLSPEERVRIW